MSGTVAIIRRRMRSEMVRICWFGIMKHCETSHSVSAASASTLRHPKGPIDSEQGRDALVHTRGACEVPSFAPSRAWKMSFGIRGAADTISRVLGSSECGEVRRRLQKHCGRLAVFHNGTAACTKGFRAPMTPEDSTSATHTELLFFS